jgi:hypothetical protein
MKKHIITLLLACSLIQGFGQARKLKFAIGAGYSSSSIPNTGVVFYMEPEFMLNEKLSASAKLETVIGNHRLYYGGSGLLYFGMSSVSLNGKFYFDLLTSKLKAFATGGFGAYHVQPVEETFYSITGETFTTTSLEKNRSAGAHAGAGIEVGHLRILVEYNFAPRINQRKEVTAYGSYSEYPLKQWSGNYLGITCGMVIGGDTCKK